MLKHIIKEPWAFFSSFNLILWSVCLYGLVARYSGQGFQVDQGLCIQDHFTKSLVKKGALWKLFQ